MAQNKLKNPPRPFVMRQWLSAEPLRKQLEALKVEAKSGSMNQFNLLHRLDSAIQLIDERDDLRNYVRALELQRRRIRRQLGKNGEQR